MISPLDKWINKSLTCQGRGCAYFAYIMLILQKQSGMQAAHFSDHGKSRRECQLREEGVWALCIHKLLG